MWRWSCSRLRYLLLAAALTMAAGQPLGAYPVGERVLLTRHQPAAARNADGSDRLRVTVWYPAADGAREETIVIGSPSNPLITSGRSAVDAPPRLGQRWPVALLSHGYGGAARAMGWFGTAVASQGYVVISVDHPGNNGIDPMTKAGAALFYERPGDLVAGLRRVAADSELKYLIDMDRIAAAGFSAGGFTALALAGGKVEARRLRAFCNAQPNDGVCQPQKEFAVPINDILNLLESDKSRRRIAELNRDGPGLNIRGAFVMAPAIVQAFAPESLRRVTARTSFVLGGADTVAPIHTNGLVAAGLIPQARVRTVAGASHYDFLGECTPAGRVTFPLCAMQVRPAAARSAAIEAASALFAEVTRSPGGRASRSPMGFPLIGRDDHSRSR